MAQDTQKDWRSVALETLLWLLNQDRAVASRAYSALLADTVRFLLHGGAGSAAGEIAGQTIAHVAESIYREVSGFAPRNLDQVKVAHQHPRSIPPDIYQRWHELVRPLIFQSAYILMASHHEHSSKKFFGEIDSTQIKWLETKPVLRSEEYPETHRQLATLDHAIDELDSADRKLIDQVRLSEQIKVLKPIRLTTVPAVPRNGGAPFANGGSALGGRSFANGGAPVGNGGPAIDHAPTQHDPGSRRLNRAKPPQRKAEKAAAKKTAKPHPAAKSSARASAEAQFTAYFPRNVQQNNWSTLLAYMHLKNALPLVEADSKRRFKPVEGEIASKSAAKNVKIARGTKILVVPQSESIEFNPAQAEFTWQEDFHAAEFRFKPRKGTKAAPGKPLPIRVGFYVSPVLVAEIDFAVTLGGKSTRPADPVSTTTEPYQKVFVSYSHDDSNLASRLEKAYKALGIDYLRDVSVLRSGEEWNATILGWIDRSEIFQLLWSEAARGSKYVRQEWKHALKLRRKQFIRPVFWQTPLPKPPQELAKLHFTYMDL